MMSEGCTLSQPPACVVARNNPLPMDMVGSLRYLVPAEQPFLCLGTREWAWRRGNKGLSLDKAVERNITGHDTFWATRMRVLGVEREGRFVTFRGGEGRATKLRGHTVVFFANAAVIILKERLFISNSRVVGVQYIPI